MKLEQKELLHEGKAKSVYATNNDDYVIMHFRNDASAFNGERVASLDKKGRVNNRFNAFIMHKLAAEGIDTHYEHEISEDRVVVKNLRMLPVECVVRNFAAGGITKRLGLEEGLPLNPPTYELFYKNDRLGDPMLSESTAIALGFATLAQLETMQALSLRINQILSQLFDEGGMILVDFKLEFGLFKDKIILGDEFSPDGCRIWDKQTKKKLDKDRFRQDLGGVVEAYEEVAARLGVVI